MRTIDSIILHCTATPAGRAVTVDDVRRYHVEHNGWADIGYHYLIYLDGSVHAGRPLEKAGAHTKGHNAHSVGVAYVGGLDAQGRPADTRTTAQRVALHRLVDQLQRRFPGATVHGHNEYSPKSCPCFNVRAEFA